MTAAIGAGGMGEVYRATDTKLGRDVALKVLPPDMARDPERLARFQREARAIAALNHPHIVTIFSVEEADGVHFLTMELVEGQSLDRRIPESGLPVEQIVEIASALADALAAAHEKGIVHRDLKPANVMVTDDGRVKVLDFGLAKDVRADNPSNATLTSAGHTQAGIVMGTPAYMSPEQISGRPLDHRTDIFSFGIILYEMATGRRPFEGTSSAELASSILRDTPAAITSARADLPADLARIIRRCLEKDPRHRVQTARDVTNEFRDLERQSSQAAAVPASRAMPATPVSGAARADEGFWVAVLPFKYTGANTDLTALAEGLTEDIVTGLSRFSYLRVIARGSTVKYSSESGDVRATGKELGARYVMEGSLRQAGTRLRLAVQLVDTTSGAHLWAETYDRAFNPEAVFELQDELVPRIVSTVAETHGVLPYSMSQTLRNRNPDELTPYEALLRGFAYFKHVNATDHAGARAALEKAVQQAPGNSDCLAMLSMLYREEYNHGFNLRPDPLGRSLAAARRAVDASPSNHLAHHALASVLYFRRELQAFRSAAQRAMELNPMDGFTIAYMGFQISFSGDWERGCALMEKAGSLNPNHPGWYWFPQFFNAYRKGDYRAALEFALKVNMPGFWRNELALAATYGQLGELEMARTAAQELLAARPEFATVAREECRKWWDPHLVEQIIDGLRKAGLEIATEEKPISVAVKPELASTPDSGATRAAEGFWVAVLPFKYTGNNADLTALVEGLTADIVTGLSRFSYLRVIARGSTAKYSSESGDIRAIGKELGARYVMEGNLRQAGTKLRLAVQLVDATTGSHLWAENYERTFDPESVFALQDELVPRIVSTIADAHGILPHTMAEAIAGKNPEQLTPYEAVLRGFRYSERISPEEHAAAQAALERAVQLAPSYAYAWAMLSFTITDEYQMGFNPRPDPLERALQAARRAVELDSSGHRGYQALALVLFYRREIQAFRTAAEKALALNPMDGCNIAHLGSFIAYAGEWERGCALVEHALQLNPNHPGWYWFPLFANAYRIRDYQGALSYALKINLPGLYATHMALAMAYGQLGQRDEAAKAVRELLKLRPDFAMIARPGLAMRYEPELVEHMIEGLRKAGLEIPAERKPASVVLKPEPASAPASGATRAQEGFWVAVLPFKYTGANADLTALAEGLTEDVVTGLSRFSYLRVIARSSTSRYANESVDVRSAGKELGARYVMEGSLRQAGTKLRFAVQLVDATTGAHLWAENYERDFSPEKLFVLQDDLVPRIVSTVADMNGVLTRSMSEAVRSRTPEQLSPYEAVLRSFCYSQRATPEELAVARSALELAVQKAPAYGDAWASLAILCVQDYAQGFNLQPDSLASGLAAARHAVKVAPSNYMAYCSLAQALFFHKEVQSFRIAAERAAALNPMDGNCIALLGELVTYTGDSERGLALVGQAKQLNPNHPGWYWYADFYHAYQQGDYRGALRFALKVNLPGHWFQHATVAAACGQLGETDIAAKALKDLLKLRPDFASTVRKDMDKWWKPDYVEHLIDGLRKAGLEIAPEKAAATSARASATSSAPPSSAPQTAPKPDISGTNRRNISLAIVALLVLAAAGVVIYLKSTKTSAIDSIAVLPLENRSNDPDADYISDGITESINDSLARLPSLSVTPHSVASHYKGKATDVRKIGDELHVQAVLAGSVAQRGDDLTVDVELDDVRNGKQLWGNQYHRKLADLLAVQNDIAREVSQRLRSQLSAEDQQKLTKGSTDNPEAYRLYLKGKYYTNKLTKEGFDTGIDYFNQAIAVDPNYALAYSGLAYNYINQDDWYMPPNEAGPKTKEAAKRALAIDESDAGAHLTLAIVAQWYDWDWAAAESEFKRAIELSPNNSEAHLYYGWFLVPMGRADEAVLEAKRAQQADPLSVVTVFSVGAVFLFARQWDPAIEQLHRALQVDPNFWFARCFLGRAYEQKGKLPEAIAEFQRALELEKNNTEIWSGLGHAYALSGNRTEAHKVLDHLKELSAHSWVAPYNVAVIYVGLGEKDQAFALLEQAYKDRSYYLPTYLTTDSRLDSLRSDPRFVDLRRRVGLPQ
ncbi:MAG: protein kinase domain-containing protein [Terriglobales bacterium]